MKHARPDYDRIQDPEGKIGEDEPVFLLRAQDKSAPSTLRHWAEENHRNGGDPALSEMAEEQANKMEDWQKAHYSKPADFDSEFLDQEFDRNAERLTREMGLGGGEINPDATSVENLFIEVEPGNAFLAPPGYEVRHAAPPPRYDYGPEGKGPVTLLNPEDSPRDR